MNAKTLKFITLSKGNNSLLLLAVFCIGLLIVRAKVTHSLFFFFLIWNLFLAWLPMGLSAVMKTKQTLLNNRWYFSLLMLAWIALLPNAPYIITDFIHLKRDLAVPVWFDVLLLISFSITGLLFGLASMNDVFLILKKKYSFLVAWSCMAGICFLSGLGIYIGRYLRYNSWDILQRPIQIISDLTILLSDWFELRAALGITIGFGSLLFILFSLYNDPEKNL